MEKPTVGPGTKLIWCKTQHWTLTDYEWETACWNAMDSDGNQGSFYMSMLRSDACQIVGGPTPETPGGPKPMEDVEIGQRRRWRGATQDAAHVFTVARALNGSYFADFGDAGRSANFSREFFRRESYIVDHGPTPTSTGSVPTQQISKAERGGEAGESPSAVDPCKGKRAAAQTGDVAPRSASRSTAAHLTARSILQAKEQARAAKRAEDAAAVAGFVDFFDLLPDAGGGR